MFAGLLTKVGIYALLRMTTLFLEPHYDDFKMILIFIAIATMVIGVMGALANKNIKQILSFHIISQVGYIFAGIALMTVNGLAGALFYLIHHILVKSNLFLVAGVIEKRFGSDQIEKTGSLYALMPMLSLTFFVSAFSLAGLPPLSGFWAKLGVLQASIKDGQWVLTVFVILVGVVTLMSMLKIWLGSFFKPWEADQNKNVKIKPVGLAMLIPCFVLGACTCVLGFYAPPFYDYTHQAAIELMNPERYIETVLGDQHD
jgi:multicomponent Na+:H+ antiporter subunit D